jgi:hypothetical protein
MRPGAVAGDAARNNALGGRLRQRRGAATAERTLPGRHGIDQTAAGEVGGRNQSGEAEQDPAREQATKKHGNPQRRDGVRSEPAKRINLFPVHGMRRASPPYASNARFKRRFSKNRLRFCG